MATDEHEMNEFGLERLAELLPGITAFERKLLFRVESEDDFSIGRNLQLYWSYVRAIERGAFLEPVELQATCGYREDLELLLNGMPDTAFRSRLLDALQSVDDRFRGATVFESVQFPNGPKGDAWFWRRAPRRTDQRRYIHDRWERTPNLPPDLMPKYEAWKAKQPPLVLGEWTPQLASWLATYGQWVNELEVGTSGGSSELVALCELRDSLDDAIAGLDETEQREQLVDEIDVTDLQFLAVTVHALPDETSPVTGSWWWWRSSG